MSFTGNSSFFRNFAVQGGAIFNYGSKLTFKALLTMDTIQEIVAHGGALYLAFNSPFHLTQLRVGRTIMQIWEEQLLFLMLTPSFTAPRFPHIYQKKIASFNFLTRIFLVSNFSSRTTLLKLQEVCYVEA